MLETMLSTLQAESARQILMHKFLKDKSETVGCVQGYVKAPLSARNGVGALSVGMIVDHTFEV